MNLTELGFEYKKIGTDNFFDGFQGKKLWLEDDHEPTAENFPRKDWPSWTFLTEIKIPAKNASTKSAFYNKDKILHGYHDIYPSIDVFEWLDNNCSNKVYGYIDQSKEVKFYFEDKQDAVRFKLIWG